MNEYSSNKFVRVAQLYYEWRHRCCLAPKWRRLLWVRGASSVCSLSHKTSKYSVRATAAAAAESCMSVVDFDHCSVAWQWAYISRKLRIEARSAADGIGKQSTRQHAWASAVEMARIVECVPNFSEGQRKEVWSCVAFVIIFFFY